MIQEYVEYENWPLRYDHSVLVWDKKGGYYFTTYGEVGIDTKIVGMRQ